MSYKLHYIDRKRSLKTSSALCFGNSIDNALNELLLTRNYAGAELVFTEDWLQYKENYNIVFYKSDSDITLLTLQQAEDIDAEQDEEKKLHLLAWYTLFQKGRAMLDAYYRDILPRIVKVISVQEPINLVGYDDDGQETSDSITGIIDLVAEVVMDDGEIVEAIIDNKTSSQPYPKNSIEKKEQTALYSVAKPQYSHVGFAVMMKKQLGRTQLLIGKPPEELKEQTMQNFLDVLGKINAGHFPQNRKSCFAFGSKCCYYSYCHKGKFDDDIYDAEPGQR
jgi:hypothetical protein